MLLRALLVLLGALVGEPPRDVYWGERTVDEMGHAAILYTADDEKLKQD